MGGGGGGNCLRPITLKLFIHIEMKFERVVKNHKLINLVRFNWQMTSSLRHNDATIVEILNFFIKNYRSKLEKFRAVSDFKKRQINDTN